MGDKILCPIIRELDNENLHLGYLPLLLLPHKRVRLSIIVLLLTQCNSLQLASEVVLHCQLAIHQLDCKIILALFLVGSQKQQSVWIQSVKGELNLAKSRCELVHCKLCDGSSWKEPFTGSL